MLRKTIQLAALTGLISAYPAVSQAVTDAEFKQLQDQLNQLADSMEANTASGSNTHIGGYGELHYNNLKTTDGPRERDLDFHRFVLEISHDFSDSIRLFTEFELEHAIAGEGQEGEVELEQAYIQFDISDSTQVNAGVFLIPVGIINESHEPTVFYGVERNPVEKNIIPATWWEGGAMVSSQFESGISFDFALTSGLDGGTSIRAGRQKVAKASADHLAVTARVKYTGIAGLELAATAQRQDDMTQDSSDNIEGATLVETHAVWKQVLLLSKHCTRPGISVVVTQALLTKINKTVSTSKRLTS